MSLPKSKESSLQDVSAKEIASPAKDCSNIKETIRYYVSFLIPLAFTSLSFYVRLHNIEKNQHVVWDEAHFGKFGSYYIKHEFYHDVHPPLGKMLIALTEWLAGFDGNFGFDSNTAYPDNVNYKRIRQYNAIFGALCTPVAYYTAKNMGLRMLTVFLIALMVTLEHSFIVLSKFILLDSMLLFFTMLAFYCMVKLYNFRDKPFTRPWSWWMLLTGVSIGCVCSVKWVGLFITLVIGLYTVMELFSFHSDASITKKMLFKHWIIRVINLILIPFLIYLFCFRIHFAILYKSGTGDASTNTLFQINLQNNKIENSPRDVMYGSEVTIRSHGLSPNLLHSHVQTYPEGSNQKQVTGYGFADGNNVWQIRFSRSSGLQLDSNDTLNGVLRFVKDGDEIRLVHKSTGTNLHSHEIPSHVSRGNFEVSGYGSESVGDDKDDWIIEFVEQLDSSNPDFPKEDYNSVHPVSTFFRLRHKVLGCYLTSTGLSYPAWGFKQAEIVCKESWSRRDKSTWWNIEEHWNKHLESSPEYLPPRSKFWTDFVLINFAMASSNNALIPDEDKYDNLATKAWEWPTLHTGLRMCSWSRDVYRYYLMGSPFNTWLSTASLFAFIFLTIKLTFQWRRQSIDISSQQYWDLMIKGGFPFISWMAHYLPFVTMGRVTYVHHYVPALYFAILVFGFIVDYASQGLKTPIRYAMYVLLFAGCTYTYIYFSPLCQGMHGPGVAYSKLQLLPTWDIVI
ncbi:hypothetical protein HG537_0E05040 [Torulaspora globosa]|uniref:Dolichyl-phosphate-mannose--protein mannosyltransferase n=1 Tax=Torulaspora globosa TaxID=48254 RepID=A0A7H9HV67_9SACH|nr:hypothetical protein HG537_0E05040 [Torulaspora sp. CBS 2947]